MHRRQCHILLVEDNPADAKLFQIAVHEASADLTIAVVTDGLQALDYIAKRGAYPDATRPGLIALDLNPPRMDGFEVLERLKADPNTSLVPVVILSTSSNPADIRKAYQRGVSAYLQKPGDAVRMFEMARSFVNYWFNLVRLPDGFDQPSQKPTGEPS